MLRIADALDAAQRELGAIGRLLDRDPDVARQQRAEKGPGPDDWFEATGVDASTIECYDFAEAAGLLRKDAMPGGAEQEMEAWKVEQRRDALRRRAA